MKIGSARVATGDQTPPLPLPTSIGVLDRVQFAYHDQMVTGTVTRKGHTSAHLVTDDQREFRVPYEQLVKLPGVATPHVHMANHERRTEFSAGDPVRFTFQGTVVHGLLVRLNPTRALVVGEDGKDYRVPYALLTRRESAALLAAPPRPVPALEATARLARDLLAVHHLPHWSFQFDNATRRAGCCHYTTQVISLSYAFAKQAPEEEIRETLLHEIAHALAGKTHHHDAVWRAQALAIGGSGRRCHDVQFTLPRYIVQCARGCWVATAERRTREGRCKRCQGQVIYQTYTAKRWASEQVLRDKSTSQETHD
jgi:predicted SprT family Zn-dependent metalloprotease/sporulation protein YlmC with PRC-barrel domain